MRDLLVVVAVLAASVAVGIVWAYVEVWWTHQNDLAFMQRWRQRRRERRQAVLGGVIAVLFMWRDRELRRVLGLRWWEPIRWDRYPDE